ncbi:hypothetical protein O181_044763 [Austropuccinia psidii MF-1]|uniref:CCHC-type domain-containing protein n=1 Tax=Austropuccinia psidii MF-1 TaxID=1389203 RepID=A0A9Q3DQP7_9BASI|nr:hypothetical protein [Austropuccinia psidii MF-1]
MRMNEALTEFKNHSGNLGDDYVMGQLLQWAIMKQPPVYRAMMNRLDTEVSCGKTTTFASCVLNLKAYYQCPEIPNLNPSFSSVTMTTRPESPAKEEHIALRTMMQLICHTCNKHGHMAKSCPEHLGQEVNTTTPTNHTFKPI